LKSRLLTFALAALLAVLGVAAVLAYVHQANTRAIAGQKAVTVLVAQAAIPAGTPAGLALTAGKLTSQQEPASSVPSDAVHSISGALSDRVTSTALAPGQLLVMPMLVKRGTQTASSTALALPLPEGDIAITMEMCLDADVAGYVQPGSYVAVFDTASTGGNLNFTCTGHQPPDTGSSVAGVVVPRVEVLSVTPASSQVASSIGQAVDEAIDPANSSNNPYVPVASDGELLVTLAATNQREADRLVALTTAGDPTFGLLTTGSNTSAEPEFNFVH
jgi:pilus assembly protein CpaB